MTTVQLADRQPSAHHEAAADDHDQRRAENRDGADDDREQRLLPRDGDARVHRRVAGRGVALQLVRLAREALDEPHRAERLVQPLEQLRLELLHALFAVDERRRVVAQAEIHERHDRQRQQRDRDVHAQQDAEHHGQRDDRRRQRKDAAHHEVLDRVRVDVDAVDGVRRARGDVMVAGRAPSGAGTGGGAGRRPSAGRCPPAPACRTPTRAGSRPAARRRR